MNKKEIYQKFVGAHPQLIKLKPEVMVSEFLDNDEKPTGVFDITVKHEFVFDNRLIPDSFEGIKVVNWDRGPNPPEFPNSNAALPLWMYYSAKNYEKFVDNNFEMIRKNLLNPNMSRTEALDALTGGFEKLIMNNLKEEKEMKTEHKESIAFFNESLNDTKKVFEKSDIYEDSVKNNWWYSVSATGIFIGKPLIVGFNWGAAQGVLYEPQKEYRFETFEGLYDELGSFKRTIKYFHVYCPLALSGMQTNFCFFRSPKESDISSRDLELSLPLFLKYVEYIKPSMLITFSGSLIKYLIKNELLVDHKVKQISNGKSTISPLKGKFVANNQKIDLVYLHHPNSPVKAEARNEAWEYCFR